MGTVVHEVRAGEVVIRMYCWIVIPRGRRSVHSIYTDIVTQGINFTDLGEDRSDQQSVPNKLTPFRTAPWIAFLHWTLLHSDRCSQAPAPVNKPAPGFENLGVTALERATATRKSSRQEPDEGSPPAVVVRNRARTRKE